MSEITVGVPECAKVRVFVDFLKKRDYLVSGLDGRASVFLICSDHVQDPTVVAAAQGFAGPKLVLGTAPPDWLNTTSIRMPALPIDVEGRIRQHFTPEAASSGRKVLMVEDDATAAHWLSAALKVEGLSATVCEGFSELAAALASRPDFIVMDLNLAGMTGDQLGKIVRAQNIPLVIFSSESAERREAARIVTGALAAFPKDASLSEIAKFIRKHLEPS